jgi:hypothetical protein
MSTIKNGELYKVEIKIGNDIITFDWSAENYKALMLANEYVHAYGDEYKDTRYHSLHKRIIDLIMEHEPSLDKVMLEAALAYKLEVLSIYCGNGRFAATWDIGETIERPIASSPYIAVRTDSNPIDKQQCLVVDYMWAGENCQYLTNNRIVLYGIPDIPDHIFMAELADDKGRTTEFEFKDKEKFYTIEEAQKEIDEYLQKQVKETSDKIKLEKFFRQLLESNGIVVVNTIDYADGDMGITIKQGDVETDVKFEVPEEDEEDEEDD